MIARSDSSSVRGGMTAGQYPADQCSADQYPADQCSAESQTTGGTEYLQVIRELASLANTEPCETESMRDEASVQATVHAIRAAFASH